MGNIKVHGGLTNLRINLLKYRAVFVVYDANVKEFATKIAAGRPMYEIQAKEHYKTIDTVLEICSWLMSQKAGRDAFLLSVGGGITLDVAGFAASIYKRGIRYANVPTTLLSMVDAGIGGKTGVNLDSYKNILGTIRQPEFTYIYPHVLRTLPERQLKSGAAEVLKTFIIKNEKGRYEEAVDVFSEPFDPERYSSIIKTAAGIKDSIVRKDVNEKGKRRVLNLGHTYGHAIEWWQRRNNVENPYTHGEAVAIGIVESARISEDSGICRPGLAEKIRNDFMRCGLPTELPCSEKELEEAVKQDKKAEGGKINFVYIKKIGKVIIKSL